jgi:sulfur relay protein TusB/DsrH
MILHTIHVSSAHPAFSDCLRVVSSEDTILLLADGVYNALAETAGCAALRSCGARLYVLQEDALACGVRPDDSFTLVNMDGFVELSENCPRQQAWY